MAVLDVAFASEGGGASFDKTTLPFIKGLGSRLAAWVDHHDHERHADYVGDPRFILTTKAEHGACPELVTPDVVRAAGPVDTVAMHLDLDGLYSGAKWVLGGVEPYEGADADARAVDTRRGEPGPIATRIDRALRARFRDETLKHRVIQYLVARTKAPVLWEEIEAAARLIDPLLDESRRLADGFRLQDGVAYVEAARQALRQDRAAAARAGTRAGRGRPRLGLADHRRGLRVGIRLREDVRPRRWHADACDRAGSAPQRGHVQARGRDRAPPAVGVTSGMALAGGKRRPHPGCQAAHAKLAEKVLSAAGGLRAGLAAEGPLPSRRDIRTLVDELLEVLFPESHRMGTDGGRPLGPCRRHDRRARAAPGGGDLSRPAPTAPREHGRRLPQEGGRRSPRSCWRRCPTCARGWRRTCWRRSIRDPAATGTDEIVACYPGPVRDRDLPRRAPAAARWAPRSCRA